MRRLYLNLILTGMMIGWWHALFEQVDSGIPDFFFSIGLLVLVCMAALLYRYRYRLAERWGTLIFTLVVITAFITLHLAGLLQTKN